MVNIRPQKPADIKRIEAINAAAFERDDSGGSFDPIRRERRDIVSLVALDEDALIGHVLFSPVTLAAPSGPVKGMGLGQLAVAPERQNQGIGTQLSKAGITQLSKDRCPFVIVIGHAKYYPRFGFEPGHLHDIQCQWQGVPPDNFMVMFPNGKQSHLTGKASFEGM